MKGIPVIRLKRFKRTLALLGAGALVAGASVLGVAQAHASLGTQPGALSFSPSSGPVTTTGITYSTTSACPAGNNGSGIVRLIDPENPNTESASTNLTQVNNNVSAPFSGTFNSTFSVIEQIFPDVVGATSEVAVYCFSGPSATGTAVVAQDTFVLISADGTYTENPVLPVTNMNFTVSPSPATVGQTVTLTATVTPSSATGSVRFSVGGTDIGSPVTVTNGAATATTSFATAGTESLSAAFIPTGSSASSSTAAVSLAVNAGPANANTIPLAVTVPSTGAFTLTVDTADTIRLMMNGNTATAMTNPIVVSDTRNTFPGWSLSAQDSNWIGSGAATGVTISGNQLGWTPTSGTSPLTQGVALGGTISPGSPGLGSTPAVLAAVAAGLGNGYGITTVGADLTLAIPTPQAAGPYISGLSLTSVSVTP